MSYTRLRYHIVFATKGRQAWLSEEIREFLYPVFGRIAKNEGGRLLEAGGVEDHVHLICAIKPTVAVSDFIGRLKANSTGALKRNFEQLGAFEWQGEFSCFTADPANMDKLRSYVANQVEHHRNGDLWELYEFIATSDGDEDDDGGGEEDEEAEEAVETLE